MKKIIVFLCLFIYFNNFSQPLTTFYLEKEVFPYLFDSGSSWVYENDSTHLKDSIIITKIVHGFEPIPHTDWLEYYRSFFKSNLLKDTFLYRYMGVVIFDGEYGSEYVYASWLMVDYFDSIKIGNKEFYNVKVIQIDTNVQFYWVKYIGIIRKDTILNNRTHRWNLISWNTNMVLAINSQIIRQNQLKLYPNPNTGKFNITSNSALSSIEVYNMTGELLYSDYNLKRQTSVDIDLSDLQKGIYFARIQDSKQVVTEKIIIQ